MEIFGIRLDFLHFVGYTNKNAGDFAMFKRILQINEKVKSFFLFGPRGTGKTCWLKENYPDALYFDLLNYSTYQQLSVQPDRLENLIPKNFSNYIILDEVQRIPELLNEVHRLIENYGYRFLLTGSSARKLRKKGVNLLAGRAIHYFMHPLTIQEIGQDFDLKKALQYGLLPEAVTGEVPNKYLTTYMQTYFREEVQQEALVRGLRSFLRFIEIASFSQGEPLNISHIAREIGIHRQTVADYFTILEDLLLAVHVYPFNKRAKRRLISHPKFYYFDVGVYRVIRPRGPMDSEAEIDGPAIETLFLQSLRAMNDYFDTEYKIYYWRTSDGVEVDFILYGPKGFLAFEIKRTKTISSKTFYGLKSFAKDYPEAKLYLIYGGKHVEYHDKITAVPLEISLKYLDKILLNESTTFS